MNVEARFVGVWKLGDIRKATPVIMLSLLLMLTAQVVSVVGHLRKDYRTIVGAVLSIISGTIMICM